MLSFLIMDSPVGELTLVAHESALLAVLWNHQFLSWMASVPRLEQPDHPILLLAKKQLEEYFVGTRQNFELPLEFKGTDFQKKVWQALLNIPYAETRSYQQIAQYIHHPKAVRAVGAANAKNPLSIIAPCHRVIGANGKLVGFSGGLDKKIILLKLECVTGTP